MIGFSVAYTTRKAQLRGKDSILASRKRIRRRLSRRMKRSRWLCCRRRHQLRPRRLERWMITCISTSQILCRGCTQIRAARSMWCRPNSRARCRVILIITCMPPWISRLLLNFRGIIRCRRFRTCSCICRSRFEVVVMASDCVGGHSHCNTRLKVYECACARAYVPTWIRIFFFSYESRGLPDDQWWVWIYVGACSPVAATLYRCGRLRERTCRYCWIYICDSRLFFFWSFIIVIINLYIMCPFFLYFPKNYHLREKLLPWLRV